MNKKVIKVNLIYSLLFVLLVAIDQFTKKWAVQRLMGKEDIAIIPDVLSLHYLENRGAAWGMFQNAIWLFAIITVVVVAVMVIFYARMPFEKHFHLLRFTIILLTAGAVGNFIDRIFQNYVIDFIYFEWINFPVFNVADCFVCIAAGLLIYCIVFHYKEDELVWKKK